ncbi:chorismate-binding protein [Alcanivorax sp. 97CO-5]|uniref:chromate efflux transporter n=1 Tax=unclassified Alcanivorax TaxID=2638842 RepID=UPI0003E7D9ED|nr:MULTISPECIES: chromate efflux transporter [unclassified Alcanivorax]EUC69809.1 chorismate-binding protein [Alcanivorax sp. 97CO-5]PKG01647.1 chorismate-binding protein [Alcanivorax sp. 97CO-6]
MTDIFRQFLLLGLISFGGPAAHVGYFHQRFVVQLQWLNDEDFARLLALTQFLPGPASSQLGFAIGRLRGGVAGAFVAFIGFTLPSFLLMGLLALYANALPLWLQGGVISGLKWLAVVVVADAVWNMGRRFCTHKLTRCLAMVVALLLIGWPTLYGQVIALLLAAIVGWRWLRPVLAGPAVGKPVLRRRPLVLFGLLAVAALLTDGPLLALWNDFFTAGALVFGGGHVVLPLLQELVGSRLSPDAFLTGYAAAQAVPGPMFSLASYLGAVLLPASPWWGALIATLAIFLPGFLLVLGLMDAWQWLSSRPALAGAVAGINAAVVGLLLAALYQPVFVSAVHDVWDLLAVLTGLLLLYSGKVPLWGMVLCMTMLGVLAQTMLN